MTSGGVCGQISSDREKWTSRGARTPRPPSPGRQGCWRSRPHRCHRRAGSGRRPRGCQFRRPCSPAYGARLPMGLSVVASAPKGRTQWRRGPCSRGRGQIGPISPVSEPHPSGDWPDLEGTRGRPAVPGRRAESAACAAYAAGSHSSGPTMSTEVCDLLDITEANQRVLLHRGRSRMREALEAEFAKA